MGKKNHKGHFSMIFVTDIRIRTKFVQNAFDFRKKNEKL